MLKRKIAPRAEAEYHKRRRKISEHCPDYFKELDADPAFAANCVQKQSAQVVLHAHQYINARASHPERDPLRTNLPLRVRAALFDAEARAAHKLKGHCELLEAYLWHRTSADRQSNSTKTLLDNLSDTEAYLHFDFKENVRYPMSQEETGDEWHAQNKLSLTVFGCTVHAPGRRNTHFLLVTDVLDHDSQIAKLMLTKILETVKTKPAYGWEKVKKLHLVADCGPHFRSRESYAFFLHDLPKQWKVNAPKLG